MSTGNSTDHSEQLPQQVIPMPYSVLPSAEEIRKFAEISPVLPEIIFRMAEREQLHKIELNHGIEKRADQMMILTNRESERADFALRINARNSFYGLLFSFISIFLIMITAVICAYRGMEVSSSIIGVGGLGYILFMFIRGSRVRTNSK